jgi:ribosomal protein S18 acetylase RimI-like enzyme
VPVSAPRVRAATPAEWDALGALCAAAYAADGLASASYQGRLRDVAARAADAEVLVAEAEVLVAEADGVLLGSVTWIPDGGPYGEIARDGEAEFRMLATAPAARGRGAGEALVRACLARGQALGRAAVVCSSASSMQAAHRLYRRLGFVRDPARAWSPLPGVDLEVFARTI